MQRCAVICAIAGLLAGPAVADEACREAVATAFNKQRTARAFILVSELKTPSGPVEIKAEYQPPDRMRQTVTAPGQAPLETVLYGQRAYSRHPIVCERRELCIADVVLVRGLVEGGRATVVG